MRRSPCQPAMVLPLQYEDDAVNSKLESVAIAGWAVLAIAASPFVLVGGLVAEVALAVKAKLKRGKA